MYDGASLRDSSGKYEIGASLEHCCLGDTFQALGTVGVPAIIFGVGGSINKGDCASVKRGIYNTRGPYVRRMGVVGTAPNVSRLGDADCK